MNQFISSFIYVQNFNVQKIINLTCLFIYNFNLYDKRTKQKKNLYHKINNQNNQPLNLNRPWSSPPASSQQQTPTQNTPPNSSTNQTKYSFNPPQNNSNNKNFPSGNTPLSLATISFPSPSWYSTDTPSNGNSLNQVKKRTQIKNNQLYQTLQKKEQNMEFFKQVAISSLYIFGMYVMVKNIFPFEIFYKLTEIESKIHSFAIRYDPFYQETMLFAKMRKFGLSEELIKEIQRELESKRMSLEQKNGLKPQTVQHLKSSRQWYGQKRQSISGMEDFI